MHEKVKSCTGFNPLCQDAICVPGLNIHGICFEKLAGKTMQQQNNVVLLALRKLCRGKAPQQSLDPCLLL